MNTFISEPTTTGRHWGRVMDRQPLADACGFEAVPLDRYETETIEDHVGSM